MLTAIGLSKLPGINASNFYYVIFHLDKVTLIYSELLQSLNDLKTSVTVAQTPLCTQALCLHSDLIQALQKKRNKWKVPFNKNLFNQISLK